MRERMKEKKNGVEYVTCNVRPSDFITILLCDVRSAKCRRIFSHLWQRSSIAITRSIIKAPFHKKFRLWVWAKVTWLSVCEIFGRMISNEMPGKFVETGLRGKCCIDENFMRAPAIWDAIIIYNCVHSMFPSIIFIQLLISLKPYFGSGHAKLCRITLRSGRM